MFKMNYICENNSWYTMESPDQAPCTCKTSHLWQKCFKNTSNVQNTSWNIMKILHINRSLWYNKYRDNKSTNPVVPPSASSPHKTVRGICKYDFTRLSHKLQVIFEVFNRSKNFKQCHQQLIIWFLLLEKFILVLIY